MGIALDRSTGAAGAPPGRTSWPSPARHRWTTAMRFVNALTSGPAAMGLGLGGLAVIAVLSTTSATDPRTGLSRDTHGVAYEGLVLAVAGAALWLVLGVLGSTALLVARRPSARRFWLRWNLVATAVETLALLALGVVASLEEPRLTAIAFVAAAIQLTCFVLLTRLRPGERPSPS